MHSYHLDIFDLTIAFKSEAGPERVERAKVYAEKLYSQLQSQGVSPGKERLLALLLLGVIDDFLQLRDQIDKTENTIDRLLRSLKEMEQPLPGGIPMPHNS